MEWETVIGLEVHVQLATQSKIFSGASTTFGAEPNTQACGIDLGMPGVLPVLNTETVNLAIKFGLSIGAKHVRLADKISNVRSLIDRSPKWSEESKRRYLALYTRRALLEDAWHKGAGDLATLSGRW